MADRPSFSRRVFRDYEVAATEIRRAHLNVWLLPDRVSTPF